MRSVRSLRALPLAIVILFLAASSLRAADTWTEVQSPNFLIVSNAGEGKARDLAWQFEQVRSAIQRGLPWARTDLDRPMTILAVKDEDTMRKLAPEFWTERGSTHPGSVFVTGVDRHYIVLRTNIEVEAQGMNPWNQAYWSYSGLVLQSTFGDRLPLWLTDGLAELLSNTIVDSKQIKFGVPIPWDAQRVRSAPLLSIADLLAVTRDTTYYRQSETRARFDSQCWSIVQFLMFSEQAQNGARFNQVMRLILSGAPSADAIQQVYGSLGALDQAYRLYINQGIFRFSALNVDTDTSRAKYPSRVLTPAESAAARAGFEVAMNTPVEAAALIAEARAADPSLVLCDDLDGLLLERQGKRDDALGAYAKAVDHGSTNFWVRYRVATEAGAAGTDQAALSKLQAELEHIATLNPRFAPAFSYLAQLQVRTGQMDRALDSAHTAAALAPADINYRVQLARLLVAANRRDDAAVVVKEAMSIARDDRERAALGAVLNAPAAPRP